MTDAIPPKKEEGLLEGIIELFAGLEDYKSPFAPTVQPAEEVVLELVQNASLKASLVSATCSLPPGPLGLLSILPELLWIYRIQGHLVKDIAALYGKEAAVSKELLLYCLFKHGGSQLFRKVVEETSIKILIRPTTVRVFQSMLERIGLVLSKSLIRKQFARWIPVGGAIVTGTFAYFDTKKVGTTAMALFQKEIHQEFPPIPEET